jgi:hypothetical protein
MHAPHMTSPEAQAKYERAQRALDHFRRVQPNLEAFARIFTHDKKMTVVPTATTSMTDGKRIFLRVDIEMGDQHRHDRELCQKRDARDQLLCEACLVRENMLVALFHEIAHVAYDSFAKMNDYDKEQAVEQAVAEAERFGVQGKRLERIRESMQSQPPRTYGEASARVSPYLQPLINALEDARINVLTMHARPGMKSMFEARATRIFEQGIEMPDGEVIQWKDQPGNAQMSIALSQYAQGHYDPDWYSPEVGEALEDPELQRLAKAAVEAGGPGEVYKLGFPILENLRSKGFFKTDQELQEEEDDEPLSNEDAPNEADDADREDTGGDDDEEGDAGSEGDSENDEPDDVDQENDAAGDGDPDDEADDESDGDGAGESDDDGDEADSDDEHGTGASGDGEGDTDSQEADDDDCAPGGEDEDTTDSDTGSGVGGGDDEGDEADDEGDEPEQGESSGDGDEQEADDDDDIDHPGDEDSDEQDPDQLAGTAGKENDGQGDDAPDRTVDGDDDDDDAGHEGDADSQGPERAEGAPDDLSAALGALCQHQHDHGGDDDDDDDPYAPDEPLDEDQRTIDIAIVQGRDFDEGSENVYETKVYETGNALNRDRVDAMPDRLGTLPVPEAVMMRSLAKLRVAFSENRKGRTDKNRRSGKINSKVLGRRVAVEDDRLFQKRRQPGKRDYFVVIGIDASASTSRGSRIQNIKTAAMAQAELLARLGVPFEVWAHSCDGNGIDKENQFGQWLETQVYRIKSSEQRWDTAARDRLESIVPWQANLDGHTMEFYRKRLDQSNATDKVLMYYTDGDMPYVNYSEELHILKRELRECERRGYTVVGVAFQTDSPKGHGLPTVRIDDGDDIPTVVEELRKRLAG